MSHISFLQNKKAAIFIFCIISLTGMAQPTNKIRTINCKIIEMDTVSQLIDETNLKDHNKAFYYDVFHIKILTPKSDTAVVGIVYQIRTDLEAFENYFGFKKDSTYILDVTPLKPYSSDFVEMRGCDYLKGKYIPRKGQVIKKPYSVIARVVESSHLYSETWDMLKSEFHNK